MNTVIIPTYNEAGNIVAMLHAVRDVLPESHLLVVDDSSPDGTAQLVEEFCATDSNVELLSRTEKEGLGKAYLNAYDHVLSDETVSSIIMMDADFSHDPEYLPELLATLARADVVIGSRYVRGGGTEGWEQWRMLLSSFGNRYCRIITGLPVKDATAGFYAIRAKTLRAMNRKKLDSSGYAFQMELKHLLWKSGARFVEVPILFKNRREGESKLSNHIILEGIQAPWKMRFRV